MSDPPVSSPHLAVVVSEADEASTHVGDHLLELADWEAVSDDDRDPAEGGGTVHCLPDAELRTFEALHLDLENVAAAFGDPDLVAFASRHSGETGPLLTAHHTGNFAEGEFGGEDRTLARAAPNAHRVAVEALSSHAPDGYEVGMECTHHGPTDVGTPSLFVEVGSGPEQWADADAAAAVARAILALREVPPDAALEDGTRRHLVGFGGGHYVPRYERVVRETDWSVGHVAADWALDAMGPLDEADDVIEQAFVESAADVALLEDHRPGLERVIEGLGYRVVDETWVRETAGVDLALVDDLEAAIAPVDDGLRSGVRARGTAGEDDTMDDFVVGQVPSELHETASGIDRAAAVATVDGVAVAYDTEQGGSVLGGTVALAAREDADALIDGFAELLASKYDEIHREGDELVATTAQFDPDRAREVGVTPGPEFGRLAEGEPVTVDGRTVRPEDVTETVERRFPAAVDWD